MDQILDGLPIYTFSDDISVVTKSTETEHWEKVDKVLERLDAMNIRLNLDKYIFAENNAKWLGFHFSRTAIKPSNSKVQGITYRLKPEILKQLRSILGSVNQMNRFIPNLAQLCFPFRLLLKDANSWDWREEHDKAFSNIKDSIRNVAEVTHFTNNL